MTVKVRVLPNNSMKRKQKRIWIYFKSVDNIISSIIDRSD